jgi:hypothetical protein
VDEDTATGLRELVEVADSFPRQFKPEFELGYWAGVTDGAERWYVRFEGDILDNQSAVLGHSAAEALRKAASEALSHALKDPPSSARDLRTR